MTSTGDKFDPSELSFEEIDQIIHSEHVTGEQLDILAAFAKHLNAQKRAEITELDDRMARIDARLKELKARHEGQPK